MSNSAQRRSQTYESGWGQRCRRRRRRIRDAEGVEWRDAEGIEGRGEWGGGFPLPSRLGGLGERRKLPQRGNFHRISAISITDFVSGWGGRVPPVPPTFVRGYATVQRSISAFVLQSTNFSHPTSSLPKISTSSPGSRWLAFGCGVVFCGVLQFSGIPQLSTTLTDDHHGNRSCVHKKLLAGFRV